MCPTKVDLYDHETGEVLPRNAITAQEAIANDPARYSLKKPKEWPPATKSASAVEHGKSSPPPAPKAPAGAGNKPAAGGRTDPFVGISGIGPSIAMRLVGAGYQTLSHLANSTADAVAAAVKVPGKTAKVIADERWIEQAQELATRPPSPPAEEQV